jgi:hypothetical protein
MTGVVHSWGTSTGVESLPEQLRATKDSRAEIVGQVRI